MTFEEFEKGKIAPQKIEGKVATIRTSGLVTLSAEAYESFGEPRYARVLVDKPNRRIRFEHTFKGNPDAYMFGKERGLHLQRLFKALGYKGGLQRVPVEFTGGGLEFTVPKNGGQA